MVLKFGLELRRWDTLFGLIRIKENQDHLDCKKTTVGLGGNLVSHFADVLSGFGRKFFRICYDNFFNSVKLVITLQDKLVKATGTIRENRAEKCPLTPNDALKKQGCRKFDFKTDAKNDVLVCKWNDNSVVNLCSNVARVHPISKASRYSSEKKRVQIDQLF